jgi:hypothetical protein
MSKKIIALFCCLGVLLASTAAYFVVIHQPQKTTPSDNSEFDAGTFNTTLDGSLLDENDTVVIGDII